MASAFSIANSVSAKPKRILAVTAIDEGTASLTALIMAYNSSGYWSNTAPPRDLFTVLAGQPKLISIP